MDDFSENQQEQARKLFAGACDFMLGVAALNQLPDSDLPEVAFAGRSNVGKSSLLNALTGRKALARTSHTPGRTQELNFFNLGGVLYLVDMPGYGYARVSKDKISAWTRLIFQYLKGRPTLRCVFILVDSRHGLKPGDTALMDMLDEAGVAYRIVLTKGDKVKDQEMNKTEQAVTAQIKKRPAAHPVVLRTSSRSGSGISTLQCLLHQYGTL